MPMNPVPSQVPMAEPNASVLAPLPQGTQPAADAVVRRLDWLFRNAPDTAPMQQLRSIVQRYRHETQA